MNVLMPVVWPMRRRSSCLTAPIVTIQLPSSTRERSDVHSAHTVILTLVELTSRAIRRVSSVRANSGRRFADSRTSRIDIGDSRFGSSRAIWRAISSMMSSTSSKKSMLDCDRCTSCSTALGDAGRWGCARCSTWTRLELDTPADAASTIVPGRFGVVAGGCVGWR